MKYTDGVLTVTAVLLAVIAWQQYDQRPVTVGELSELMHEDPDKWETRRAGVPVTYS